MPTLPTYVLITAARNEAQLIERTIKAVVAQTVRPIKWLIVSDGSTDGTDDIVARYAADHPWMELVRMPERRERHFAGKAHAFNAGHARVKGLDYDVIGNLDADVDFDAAYFDFLLRKFVEYPCLGVAGTPFVEGSQQYDYRFTSIDHVSGACQLFRRECFDAIGGYIPIRGGGIDWAAVTTARMKGWQTRTFPERTYTHHRTIGTGQGAHLASFFRFGKQDFCLGAHPLWEVFRCVYQMSRKPYVVRGLLFLSGYLWACLSGMERAIPQELVEFRHKEQMLRLKTFFRKTLGTLIP